MADHPAPWRWRRYGDNFPRMLQLLDALGGVVLELPHAEVMARLDPALAAAIEGLGEIMHVDRGIVPVARAARLLVQRIDTAKIERDPRAGMSSIVVAPESHEEMIGSGKLITVAPDHSSRLSVLWYEDRFLISETVTEDPPLEAIDIPLNATRVEMIPFHGDRELCRRCRNVLAEWACDRRVCRKDDSR